MEASLNYREKLWIDSLDICNSNLKNMYNAQGEFEGALYSIGGKQNELIKTNAKMLDSLPTSSLKLPSLTSFHLSLAINLS